MPRPFLKWAGGKGQLLPALLARVPAHFDVYYEPFLGGGALFFALWREGRIRHAVLSDLNPELIDTYIAIRDHVEDVIRLLEGYRYDRRFYYELRDRDPWTLDRPERAARMIYLNRTCYNGLYRLNRQGRFNVPFGRYRHPRLCSADNLRAVSRALRSAEILCADFAIVLDRARAGDFVYMDPPYAPVSKTARFTAYTADGFGPSEQRRLSQVARLLRERGVFVMISNSALPEIRRLYRGFRRDVVNVTRAVNRRGDRRDGWKELIIW
jgi:DNA adenine methylase